MYNVFRILADLCHTASKCILIWAIHWNHSAEGVSLLTQMLYAVVFISRYLDLFWTSPADYIWNFVLKNFYIWSSLYIIYIMLRVFARTREREKAWKLGAYALGGSILLTPIVGLIFDRDRIFRPTEFLWAFSLILESVCVLPQLLLLRQTTVPTVIDSGYLIALGSYRLLYLINWIYRMFTTSPPEAIPVIFGVIQTALYLDFAWVYWTRQRVKLRGGGVVDSDDLRKGFLVHRALDRTAQRDSVEDPEVQDSTQPEQGPRQSSNRWGARGVSVSADDTLSTHHQTKSRAPVAGNSSESDAILNGEEDDIFFDDHDDDAPALDEPALNSNAQWRDDEDGVPK